MVFRRSGRHGCQRRLTEEDRNAKQDFIPKCQSMAPRSQVRSVLRVLPKLHHFQAKPSLSRNSKALPPGLSSVSAEALNAKVLELHKPKRLANIKVQFKT